MISSCSKRDFDPRRVPRRGVSCLTLLPLLVACGGEPEVTPSSSPEPTITPDPTPDYMPAEDPVLRTPGSWDNATVYFVITDRFYDGNPGNNSAYGRSLDGGDEIGTFHGGDLVGLKEKVESGYFNSLGVTALWITAPYEQIHGWVVGGSSEFKHYAYHGYYALDYTQVDQAMGTPDDLGALVDAAHAVGIRIILDVVMNHPGYASLWDMDELGVDVLKDGWDSATLSNYHSWIDYQDPDFADWWGVGWIRAGLGGGYDPAGTDDLTKSLASLPDFKTESTDDAVGLPPFFDVKTDTAAVEIPGYTVRDYLITWLTDWVSAYGIDGFRCDTVKHVEKEAWAELKVAANLALASWRAANPEKALSDEYYANPTEPFWMVGEVFPHSVAKDDYFQYGFDALINFDFSARAGYALDNFSSLDEAWSEYAAKLNPDPTFNMLSYISSHDTALFFDKYAGGDARLQEQAGTLLLLTPGAVQIFYGDENARPLGPKSGDATQATRSDYLWDTRPHTLNHWRKVAQFRRKHPAVGQGAHQMVAASPYMFTRILDSDVVYVVMGVKQPLTMTVGRSFPDGTRLRNFYTGEEATVSDGRVTFTPSKAELLLIEAL